MEEIQDKERTFLGVPRRSWKFTVTVLWWFGTMGYIMWSMAPRFKNLFESVKVDISHLTIAALNFSWFFCAYPFLWVALTALAVIGVLRCPEHRRVEMETISWIVMLVALSVMVLALHSPLLSLLEGLSG